MDQGFWKRLARVGDGLQGSERTGEKALIPVAVVSFAIAYFANGTLGLWVGGMSSTRLRQHRGSWPLVLHR